jgi:hypothetical protein
MSEDKKAYFVKNDVLFCNTIFAKEGVPEDVPLDAENSEPTKSFYELGYIVAANMSTIKKHTTVRTSDGHSYNIDIPFKELVKIKYGIEI